MAGKYKMSKMEKKEHYTALLFISIKYIGFITFTVVPLIFAVLFSFTKFNPIIHTDPFFSIFKDIFASGEQYKNLFTHPVYGELFKESVLNTLILLISVPFGIACGLMVAVLLCNMGVKKGISKIMRLTIYLPVVASVVAMSIIWRYMFDNEFGIINFILGKNDIYWLSDPWLLKTAIIIKNTWGAIGGSMILFSAAIMAISPDYYEVAELSGANAWQKFRYVTLPLITPTVFYLLIVGIIGHMQAYADAEIFAQGATGARTVVYFIWLYGIRNNNYGLASAASVLLSIAIMGLTLIQFKFSGKWVHEGE